MSSSRRRSRSRSDFEAFRSAKMRRRSRSGSRSEFATFVPKSRFTSRWSPVSRSVRSRTRSTSRPSRSRSGPRSVRFSVAYSEHDEKGQSNTLCISLVIAGMLAAICLTLLGLWLGGYIFVSEQKEHTVSTTREKEQSVTETPSNEKEPKKTESQSEKDCMQYLCSTTGLRTMGGILFTGIFALWYFQSSDSGAATGATSESETT